MNYKDTEALQVSNLLAILNNGELCKLLDNKDLDDMKKAVVLYGMLTSRELLENLNIRKQNEDVKSNGIHF